MRLRDSPFAAAATFCAAPLTVQSICSSAPMVTFAGVPLPYVARHCASVETASSAASRTKSDPLARPARSIGVAGALLVADVHADLAAGRVLVAEDHRAVGADRCLERVLPREEAEARQLVRRAGLGHTEHPALVTGLLVREVELADVAPATLALQRPYLGEVARAEPGEGCRAARRRRRPGVAGRRAPRVADVVPVLHRCRDEVLARHAPHRCGCRSRRRSTKAPFCPCVAHDALGAWSSWFTRTVAVRPRAGQAHVRRGSQRRRGRCRRCRLSVSSERSETPSATGTR